MLLANSCACRIVSLVTEASCSVFCHETVLSLTFLVSLIIALNFLEPFFLVEKSFLTLLMFHSGTALFIDGGGYFPFLEKVLSCVFSVKGRHLQEYGCFWPEIAHMK